MTTEQANVALVKSLDDIVDGFATMLDVLAAVEANFAAAEKGRLSRRDAGRARGACRTCLRMGQETRPMLAQLVEAIRQALDVRGGSA